MESEFFGYARGAFTGANKEGKAVRQLMVPVGAVTDERVCGGASYAVAMRTLLKYMLNPASLETLEEEQPET